jgi:hypothetical protein
VPNKHFSEAGAVAEVSGAIVAGDDPRSTNEIRADLEKLGIKVKKSASRKELFARWCEETKKTSPVVKKEEPEGDPLEGKKFSELGPEDIENIKVAEIVAAVKHRFSIDMKFGGKKKTDLIKFAIDLEQKHTGAMA